MEDELSVVVYDGMTSVVSAGKSYDYGGVGGEEVDDLPLAFVAP